MALVAFSGKALTLRPPTSSAPPIHLRLGQLHQLGGTSSGKLLFDSSRGIPPSRQVAATGFGPQSHRRPRRDRSRETHLADLSLPRQQQDHFAGGTPPLRLPHRTVSGQQRHLQHSRSLLPQESQQSSHFGSVRESHRIANGQLSALRHLSFEGS